MNKELIAIIKIMNTKHSFRSRFCINFSQSLKCKDVDCETCPLFYEPDYFLYIAKTQEKLNE